MLLATSLVRPGDVCVVRRVIIAVAQVLRETASARAFFTRARQADLP